MNKDIKRTTIHFYEGYKYEGEYVPVKLRNTLEIEYDPDGRVKSRTYYNYNEAKLSDISDDTYVTRRRVENGVVIYEEFDSNNEIVGYNKYDREGHLLESLSLNGQKFFYSYYENGNEIEHHSLDEDGKLLYRTRYEYDSNDRMTRSFHENDEPCSCQHYYSRDVKGNIVMTTLNDVDDYVYSHLKGKDHEFAFETKDELFEDKYINEVRLFDKKGNQLSYFSWSEDDLIDSSHMTYYKYDDRGNWVMRIEPQLINWGDLEPESTTIEKCTISIREIEYYSEDIDIF
jgi:hypothetical protein